MTGRRRHHRTLQPAAHELAVACLLRQLNIKEAAHPCSVVLLKSLAPVVVRERSRAHVIPVVLDKVDLLLKRSGRFQKLALEIFPPYVGIEETIVINSKAHCNRPATAIHCYYRTSLVI